MAITTKRQRQQRLLLQNELDNAGAVTGGEGIVAGGVYEITRNQKYINVSESLIELCQDIIDSRNEEEN